MSAERTYQRGKKTREAKKKIMAASEAGKYKGPGLGQAKGREMVKKVKEANKKDMEKYGGMDMPTKAKGGSVKKMAYGGEAMKMAKGGKLPMVKKDGKMVPAFAADGKGKMAYGGKVKKMADGGEIGRKIRDAKPVPMPKATPKKPKYNPKKILEEYRKKTGSSPSRRIASGGKVKKMAYGGSVKKTGARRADGCAVRGKTKGRMV